MQQDGKADDRYIEIHWTGTEYDVQIRWVETGEQHEVHVCDDMGSLLNVVRKFYETPTDG